MPDPGPSASSGSVLVIGGLRSDGGAVVTLRPARSGGVCDHVVTTERLGYWPPGAAQSLDQRLRPGANPGGRSHSRDLASRDRRSDSGARRWLTSRTDSDQGWKVGSGLCAYVIVEVPDEKVVPWSQYRQELPPGTVSGLETSARFHGKGEPSTWFVMRRGFREAEWVEIIDLPDVS